MKNEPFVTVFTPNYNNSKYISETIESILNQSYRNFEYIIIDDCSTDHSWEVIQEYAKKDYRIKAFRNEANLKIVKTRNKGFNLSSPMSKYFAIIDSDDVALPTRLEMQLNFLERNLEYGLVGSNIIIINEDSKEIGKRSYPLEDEEIRNLIIKYNPFAQSSILLRKTVIEQIGLYDEEWFVCQDYDYWLRVGKIWKLHNLSDPLIKYRFSSSQVKKKFLKETIRNTIKIQKKGILEYNYDDNLFNKFYRFILKLSIMTPKLAYLVYKKQIKHLN